MRLEDIEVEKLYVADQQDIPFCVKVTALDLDPAGAFVKVITIDETSGEPWLGSVAHWVRANRIGMLWSEFKTEQAEKQRARELERVAEAATLESIRGSLRALGVDTFFDIDIDRNCDVVQITLDPKDLAAFIAELVRAANRDRQEAR